MTTEGAGGLSTATLDSLLGFVKDGEVLTAARAELAALVEAAGRATALVAALAAWQAWEAYLQTEPWDKSEMIEGGTLHQRARRLTRAALADAEPSGPGAAGARDETPPRVQALEAVALAARTCCEGRRAGDRAYAGLLLPTEVALEAALARLDLLDASRAGGAGETDKEG